MVAVHDRVLVTGFEPFGGEDVNPSWEAALRLDGLRVDGAVVVARQLPVRWRSLPDTLFGLLETVRPRVVVMVGQSIGRAGLALERVAINVREGVDNDGVDGAGEPVVPDGPDGLFATLPLRPALGALRAAGLPAYISNTAGTYLCNAALYLALWRLRQDTAAVPAGFVHVPALPAQAARRPGPPPPSMPVEEIARGVRIVLETTLAAAR